MGSVNLLKSLELNHQNKNLLHFERKIVCIFLF